MQQNPPAGPIPPKQGGRRATTAGPEPWGGGGRAGRVRRRGWQVLRGWIWLICLGWTAAIGASSPHRWRSTNNGASWQLITNGLTVNAFVDAKAVSRQTNDYEVAAANSMGTSPVSSPVAVLLTNPVLSWGGMAGNVLTLRWPAWASGWALYYATNLVAPIRWLPSDNLVVRKAGQLQVSMPITSDNRFFRLAYP